MKRNQDSDQSATSGANILSGSANLIGELQLIFAIYAKDLKTFREGGSEFELLANTEMFDIVVKLLNVSDKIKKLDVVEPEDDKPKPDPKVRNLQDLVLKDKNA